MSAQNKSEWATIICGLQAPVMLWCSGVCWLWVLCGGALAAAVYALVCWLQPKQSSLTSLTLEVLGRTVGSVVMWLQLLTLALGAGILLRWSACIVPNLSNGYPWVPVVLVVLALAAAWGGTGAVDVCGSIIVWVPVVGIAAVLLMGLPQMQGQWMRPEGPPWQILPAAVLFLLPVTACYQRPGGSLVKNLPLQGGCVILGTLVAFVTAACISPGLAAREQLPFFILAASERLLGLASRFDAVLSAAVAAALFCLLARLLTLAPKMVGRDRQRWPLFAFAALLFVGASLAHWIPYRITLCAVAVAWGIVPCLVVLGGCAKNIEKTKKRC